MHSSHMLREGARPEVVRDNMGHANINVTQNVYGKSWWEERVDAVTQAVEGVTNGGWFTPLNSELAGIFRVPHSSRCWRRVGAFAFFVSLVAATTNKKSGAEISAPPVCSELL